MSTTTDSRLVPQDAGWKQVKVNARELLAKRTEEILASGGKLRAMADVDDYLAALEQAAAENPELASYAEATSGRGR
jgi:hypothetical protein